MPDLKTLPHTEVAAWIMKRLVRGPVASKTMIADALAAGFTRGRLVRAKARLSGWVECRKRGLGGWEWVAIKEE